MLAAGRIVACMIVTLLMTLEGSLPEVSRCINVDDSMDLGSLSQVIDAAFGFSGAATHLYATGSGQYRQLFTELPGADEANELELMVSDISQIAYIYDPTANWNINIEVLGESELEGPTPLLVDASGPDIVEAANGPEMMTRFRHEARRIAAGLSPDMEVTPLLLSFLPVMSPERMLERLTVSDPVTVATRIGFVAEELYFDQAQQVSEHPESINLTTRFEEFLDSRPELREILQTDPNPDRNPTLIAAVAEFFEEAMGDDASLPDPDLVDLTDLTSLSGLTGLHAVVDGSGPGGGWLAGHDHFSHSLQAATGLFRQPVELTQTGKLPVHTVRELAEVFNLSGAHGAHRQPRESTFQAVALTRQLLTGAGLIAQRDNVVQVTDRGNFFLQSDDPVGAFHTELLLGFEAVFGEEHWRQSVLYLSALGAGGGAPVGDARPPEAFDQVEDYLRDIGALFATPEGPVLAPDAAELVARMAEAYGYSA